MKIYLQIQKARNGIILKTFIRKFFIFNQYLNTYVYVEEEPITKELLRLTKDE